MFFAVSIPLMAITFGIAIGWYWFERRQKRMKYKRIQLDGEALEGTYTDPARLKFPWEYWKDGRIPSKSL